jgi:hypothetical protein
MSAATVVLFIFVSHSPASRPPDGVVAACVRALPEGARPLVRAASAAPADDALAADAAAAGAGTAVVVTWEDPSLLAAQVRVLTGLPAHPRWSSRRLSFDTADQAPERDRALGLVIASMIDEGAEAAPAPRPPPVPVVPPPPAAAPPTIVRSRPVGPSDQGPRWALDANVVTAVEKGADLDDTIGGAVGLRRALPYDLAVRVGLMFRVTERDSRDIRTSAQMVALGLAWAVRRPARTWALGLGLRADLLAVQETVRFADDGVGGADEQAFRSLGADLLAEVGLGLSADAALLLGLGGEMMFTTADLRLGNDLAAMLPRSRLVTQLGVMARF